MHAGDRSRHAAVGVLHFAQYDKAAQHTATYYFTRQLVFAVAGLIMYIVTRINYQHYRWMSLFFILIAACVCLLLVFTPLGYGGDEVGAQRWINLGPINFQPSEIAKIGVILYFSARLSKRRDGTSSTRAGGWFSWSRSGPFPAAPDFPS